MEPRKAAEIMMQEAEIMLKMIDDLQSKKPSAFLKKDLLDFACFCLQQHADFKKSISEIFYSISEVFPEFNLEIISQNETQKRGLDLENPPFDAEFWSKLDDLNN
jgi:hypothetical protein